MLEFVFASAVFLPVVLMLIDCTIAGYRTISYQYVASRAARFGVVHGIDTEQIRTYAIDTAGMLNLKLTNDELQVCSDNQLDNDGNCDCVYTPGGGSSANECNTGEVEDFVIVRIDTTVPLFFRVLSIPILAGGAGMKEAAKFT